MGEVIPLRRGLELDARAARPRNATTLSQREINRETDRRMLLPDPDADLAALPLRPLPPVDVVASQRRQIEAELEPAGRDAAARTVRSLSKTMKIPGPDIVAD